MKKSFLLLVLLMLTIGATVADPGNGGGNLPLIIKTTNPGGEHQQFPKSPIHIPAVYLDGNVLTFDAALEGCTVQLLDEEETVVFSDSIEENQTSLVLPSALSGTYELQIICGDIMFYAFIEL